MPDEAPVDETAKDSPDDKTTDTATDEELGEGGKKALDAERAQRKELEAKLKELEPLAAKARELEEANKTEAQRQAEQLEAANRRAEEQAVENARFKVAAAKGLPLEVTEALAGANDEEIGSSADVLTAYIDKRISEATQGDRRPDPRLGRDKQTPPASAEDWFRSQL